jgi:hypothetical protein
MKVKIDFDGVNVHLSIEAETSKIVRAIMVFLNFMGVVLILIGIYEWLLILVILGALWVVFFGWLTLWNFFGRELITINTKQLTYQHQYGFYKNKVESRNVSKALNISLIPAVEHHGENYFQLIFESYNELNLPEEIYRSAFPISQTDLNVLKISIRKLYFKKVHPDYINQPYLLN